MCEYCNLKENETEQLDGSVYLCMNICRRETGYYLYAFESDDVEVKINYCPICGRELNNKESEKNMNNERDNEIRDIENVFAAVVDICNAKNLMDEAIPRLFARVMNTIDELEKSGFVKRDK